MLDSGVYIIENIINGRLYIGSSSKLDHRYKCHLNSLRKGIHHSWKLQTDFNRYGEDKFIHRIIVRIEGEIIRKIEYEMILFFDTMNNGYNVCTDTISRGGSVQTQETRDKISKSLKRFKKENGHNKTGSKHSEETKKKMSEAQKKRFENLEEIEKYKNRVISDETKKKLSAARKGKKMSEEQKKLLSSILTGKKRAPLTEEHKNKISETFRKKRESRDQSSVD